MIQTHPQSPCDIAWAQFLQIHCWTHNVIVDGPESVELQSLDVPVSHRVHLEVWLVAHHVIHKLQVSGRSAGRELLLKQ